ncbi:MAG TPA: hypothetical protein VL651_07105 [Bacteroidia bacterium]|jgi:hypothetical protein|nr:hypothetical protein [Bacteroidia bacterium]
MKALPLVFAFLLSAFASPAQITPDKNWKRSEVSCMKETYTALSAQAVIANPDTVISISFGEDHDLKEFLTAHERIKSDTSTYSFDIRTVYTFADGSGKQHLLGFDCFGDYFLDGKYYGVTEEIKKYEVNLHVGWNK